MDINKTLNNYLEELASDSPTPGGGNVAALCGVLSSALGEMVCNLTIGKKKYAEVESEVKALKEKMLSSKERFITLGNRDNDAFNGVMEAFKLPKETDTDKQVRKQKIEEATLHAAVIPSQVVNECEALLPIIKRVTEIGNQNSLSDAGVGASLLRTASEGAFLNVLINCSGIPANTNAAQLLAATESANNQNILTAEDILSSIRSRLKVS